MNAADGPIVRAPARRALIGALLASLVLLPGCGKEEKKDAARPPTEVTALTIVARDVPVSTVFVAQTQSSQAVNIQARVSGFLDKRVYTEGEVVKAGQVLFRMDPKPFQAQVERRGGSATTHRPPWTSRSSTSTAPSRWRSRTHCRRRTSTTPRGSTCSRRPTWPRRRRQLEAGEARSFVHDDHVSGRPA